MTKVHKMLTSSRTRLTAVSLLFITALVSASASAQQPCQEIRPNQQQQKQKLSFDERTDLLKQELAAAAEKDVPEIVFRALRELGHTKVGGSRMRTIVSVRLDESMPILMDVAADNAHEDSSAAEWAIRTLRDEAKPWLVVGLKSQDNNMRRLAVRNLTDAESLAPLLQDQDPYMRHKAAITLLAIESHAQAATELLTREYEELGEHKRDAMQTFGRFGDPSPVAQQLNRKFLADPDREFRSNAAHTLFSLGVLPQEEFVPQLIEALDTQVGYYQIRTILYLAAVGPRAKDALDELQEIANGDDAQDAEFRAAALIAICHVDPQQIETCLPQTFDFLSADDNLNSNLREDLLLEIGRLGTSATMAVPALQEMFAGERERRHVNLALTVLEIDADGPERGLAMFREILAGTTPNPQTTGYPWRESPATSVLAPDLMAALTKATNRNHLRQLCRIWSGILPKEAAQGLLPQVRKLAEQHQNKRLQQQLNIAINRVQRK